MTTFDKIKKIDFFSLFARLVLALSFLSAVADRFGLWTPILGRENVTWGNMENFIGYTGTLIPWISSVMLPFFAWGATVAEIVLGLLLIIGFQKRLVALFSGVLLLM